MHRKTYLKIIFVALGLTLMSSQAQARIKYGLWQITVTAQMDGMPVDTPQETFEQCISRKNLTPGDNKDKEGCKDSKVNRKGDTVTWTVSCAKDNHTMKGNGVVVYNDKSMTGHAQFQAGGKGLATMKMRLEYQGKYLKKRCN